MSNPYSASLIPLSFTSAVIQPCVLHSESISCVYRRRWCRTVCTVAVTYPIRKTDRLYHRTSHRFFKVTAIHRPHTVPRLLYSIQRYTAIHYTAIQRYTLYTLYTIPLCYVTSLVRFGLFVCCSLVVRVRESWTLAAASAEVRGRQQGGSAV